MGRAAAGPGGFEGEPASRQGKLVFKIDEKPFPCEGRGEGLCGVSPGYRSPRARCLSLRCVVAVTRQRRGWLRWA